MKQISVDSLKIYCNTDSDCPPGAICMNGKCFPIEKARQVIKVGKAYIKYDRKKEKDL